MVEPVLDDAKLNETAVILGWRTGDTKKHEENKKHSFEGEELGGGRASSLQNGLQFGGLSVWRACCLFGLMECGG